MTTFRHCPTCRAVHGSVVWRHRENPRVWWPGAATVRDRVTAPFGECWREQAETVNVTDGGCETCRGAARRCA